MARNHLEDARDHFQPPSRQEELMEVAEKQGTIDAITPTAKQNEQLKESGLHSIIDDN